MAIQKIVRITTDDTKKTYEFPHGDAPKPPQLWEVAIITRAVDQRGHVDSMRQYGEPKDIIYVERETLENAGVLGKQVKLGEKHVPIETVEDLIIRLLEHVGYYPCPENM